MKLFFLGLFFSLAAVAAPPCAENPPAGLLCECQVASLRPTQASVGYLEVKRKQGKLGSMKKKKLEKYLLKHPEPVIVGPGNKFFITDHHHLARALLDEGISSTYCQITDNLSKLAEASFWAELKKKKMVYLFDENEKPISPERLPKTIADLKDDPFRSIAGQVRERGGFEKSKTPFSEFAWAGYFRSRMKKPANEKEMNEAIQKAMELAKKPEAKGLSGFVAD